MSYVDNLIRILSVEAFSADMLGMLQEAVATVRRHYPKYNFLSRNHTPDSDLFEVNPLWEGYASRVVASAYVAETAVTPSKRKLLPQAQPDLLEDQWNSGPNSEDSTAEDIVAYLELLRKEFADITISGVMQLQDFTESIHLSDSESTTIIPVRAENLWAFAVRYPDCLHWYDCNDPGSKPDFVSSHWTGPMLEEEDSGILMLLGVRRIASGLPHLDTMDVQRWLPHFLVRLFIELVCGRLNPSDQQVQSLIVKEDEWQSRHFEEALEGMSDTPRSYRLTPSPAVSWPEHGDYFSQAYHATMSEPSASASGSEMQWESGMQLDASSQEESVPSSSSSESGESGWDDHRWILQILSDAVAAVRLTNIEPSTHWNILWSLVRRGEIRSVFHHRYCQVLFYDKISDQEPDVRKDHSRYGAWKELCELGKQRNIYEHAMLCAIPEGDLPEGDTLHRVSSRLMEDNDPLTARLQAAEGLCRAIVEHNLPSERLMVELYPDKKHEDIDEGVFAAFVSVDPHVKLPIPRVAF